jgi:RNA polymerase sigma-70 factor (ECF subfamily)
VPADAGRCGRAIEAPFAALFGYFAPRVKAFLMRSGLSAIMAEEVTQETMLAIWRNHLLRP